MKTNHLRYNKEKKKGETNKMEKILNECQIKVERQNLKNRNGITLIALVITIIVLLILAGVVISMLSGENGILTRTQNSKITNTIEGEKEAIAIAYNGVKIQNLGLSIEADKLEDELKRNGYKNTKATLKGKIIEVEFTETGNIYEIEEGKITHKEVNDEIKEIGDVYDPYMIGKNINYTSETALPDGINWIILGQDKNGDILLTTSKPIEDKVSITNTVGGWLTYENDLKDACSVYGTTIQEKTIKSESITLEHINLVTNFNEPEIKNYVFSSTYNFNTQEVNYYHPDLNADTKWSKEEEEYKSDSYYYYVNENNKIICAYEGSEFEEKEFEGTLNNMDIITGENNEYAYLVGTTTVAVTSDMAIFYITTVEDGIVHGDGAYLCYSNSGQKLSGQKPQIEAIRPVVTLPHDIQVELVNGEWSIITSSNFQQD